MNVADLEHHARIGFDEETPFLRAAQTRFPPWRREAFSLRSDSDLAQLAMIRAGCGIGICQVAIARKDASLVRVLGDSFVFHLDTWVTMHGDLRGSRACMPAFNALVECLEDHVEAV